MLADTDRHSSIDVVNPAADNKEEGGGGVQGRDLEFDQVEHSDVGDSEEGTVLSEHLLTRFDQQLSRGENRPTPVFYGAQLALVMCSLQVPFGTWCTVSLADAVSEGDALMAAGVILVTVGNGVIGPLLNSDARNVFRADADGPLVLLGVGQQRITVAQDKVLRAFNSQANTTYFGPNFLVILVVWSCIVSYILVTGAGVQESPDRNRFSAVTFSWMIPVYGSAILNTWAVALMSATVLVDARTSFLRAAVRTEQRERQGEAFWDSAVVAPAKELLGALEVLNENFARGLILQLLWCSTLLMSVICVMLSKWFAALDGANEIAIGVTVCFAGLLLAAGSIRCTMLLGQVSTSCDDFTEDLNTLRLKAFDDDTHARVLKLEIALKNANHGQGIGFKVGGVVLTKKILFIMFVEMITGLAFVVPIVLSHSAMGMEVGDGATRASNSPDGCALSSHQQNAVKGMLESYNNTCGYAEVLNATVWA